MHRLSELYHACLDSTTFGIRKSKNPNMLQKRQYL